MDEKSEGGRENGGGNDTNDTKEDATTQAADSGDTENGVVQNVTDDIKTQDPEEHSLLSISTSQPKENSGVTEKCGVKRDTDHGEAPNAANGGRTKACQGPGAVPEAKTTLVLQDTRGVETKAEVNELDDEAQIATKDNNISQGKTDKTKAPNSEKQPDPDCSQGGISDSNLEKLAKALMGEEFSARSLGRELGFSPTDVFAYCGYGKPKDSSGILRMLRAWKRKTVEAKQISGLLEALEKANLKHLADDLNLQEGAEEQREAVQTSNGDSVTPQFKSVQATTTRSDPLKDNQESSPSVVPGAKPDPNTEDASPKGSEQTYEEESGGPQITDSSSEPTEAKPNTGQRDHTMNPTTPDRNSGSKDLKDKEGHLAREKKAKAESEEEKGPMEQIVSKEGAATTEGGTKEDGPTKQKDNEKKVEAVGTEQSAESAEEPFENISKDRSVSISVCTSANDFNVQGLVSFLKDIMKYHPELIKEVKVHSLPYNDLDHYKFPKGNPVDVMLLCHSINNREFVITDVMDALYDEYLPYCARVVGKNKMGVIVHDFEDMRETVQSSRMSSFKYKQPKAFETTSLQIICGHIEKKEQVLNQMLKADREKIPEFLKNASTFPEQMMKQATESQSLLEKGTDMIVTSCKKGASLGKQTLNSIRELMPTIGRSQDTTSEGSRVDRSEAERNDHGLTKKGTSSGTYQTPQASVDEMNLNPPRDESPLGQQRPGTSNMAASAHTRGLLGKQSVASRRTVTAALQMPSPRRISVSVCSSAYEHKVKGLLSNLTELQAGVPHMFADVRFRSLPYNDIDSFRFPSNDPVDVMVLCHSVQNRGFSITNVLNALYEKYLQYCHDVIGKKKLAVIVHDFSDCKPKTLDVRMESFRRSQPLTFELADTVIVCGSLEKPGKIEMRDEDMRRLTTFFEQARYEQKENYAVKQSLKKIFPGMPLPWK